MLTGAVKNDIAVSTFYTSRCQESGSGSILPPNYGHLEVPRPKQDVVPIDIVPDHVLEQHNITDAKLAL